MRGCCFKVVLILSAEIMQVWCFQETRPAQVSSRSWRITITGSIYPRWYIIKCKKRSRKQKGAQIKIKNKTKQKYKKQLVKATSVVSKMTKSLSTMTLWKIKWILASLLSNRISIANIRKWQSNKDCKIIQFNYNPTGTTWSTCRVPKFQTTNWFFANLNQQ